MADTKKCLFCDGKGYRLVLVSQHSDEKETVKCTICNGKGVLHHMTEKEESDYWEDYW